MKRRIELKQKKNGASRNSLGRQNRNLQEDLKVIRHSEKILGRELELAKEYNKEMKSSTKRNIQKYINDIDYLEHCLQSEAELKKDILESVQESKKELNREKEQNEKLKTELEKIVQKEEGNGLVKRTLKKVLNL